MRFVTEDEARHIEMEAASPPTREESYLWRAREAYVDGLLSLEELEEVVDNIFRGGRYSLILMRESPFPQPRMQKVAK